MFQILTMTINIKKFRIARLLIVLFIFGTYSWLVIWTTKKITLYSNQRSPSSRYDVDVFEKLITQEKAIPVFDTEKHHKQFNLNHTATKDCPKQLAIATKRWFYARFDSDIETSWTVENSFLNHDVYAWWLSLQNSQGVNTVMTLQKLQDIGVGKPKLSDVDKCKKCAVIGNSGNLLHSRYGKEIDSHDSVIRINKAPTTGFEDDVGSKTTHRFMYPESALTSIPQEVSFVLIPFKPMDIKWLLSALTTGEIQKTYAPVPQKVSCNKSRIKIINPSFIRYVHNRWIQQNGRYPSTGFLAVIYALHRCGEINLYGFGADQNGNWHHYWEELSQNIAGAFKSTGVHDSLWERTILDQLDAKGIVHLNIKKT